jgi:AcrR family transcriptional regulator
VADGADTRSRLLDATIEVIATRGESAVRMVEIAEAAGIKQPSIYHFFPSREDLVVAAHLERYRRAVAEALGQIESEVASAMTRDEFVEAVSQVLRLALSDDRREVWAVRLGLLAKAMTNESVLREVNDATFEGNVDLAAMFERAQRTGWVRGDVSPLTLTVFVRSLIFGRLIAEMDGERYDYDEWTSLTLESFWRSVAPA